MVNKMSTAFCLKCGCMRSFKTKSSREETSVKKLRFSFIEKSAYCLECNEELYVPEINDENVQTREDAYRKAAGLITVDEIKKIMEMYSIGAEPLSLVMGFGEVTIARYLGGQLPLKANSDKLFEILSSYKKMEERVEKSADALTPVAYRKCKDKLNSLKEFYGEKKIEVVTRYFLRSVNDITPLALQKLLYYAQAFFFALFNVELFTDSCQAWVHGPVYPDVYHKYKIYGYNPIEQPVLRQGNETDILTTREKELLNAIISTFGWYSGDVLEKMTHKEIPWIETRGNLHPEDRSEAEIERETIHKYFKQVVVNYNIVNPCDIVNYSNAMRTKIIS